MNRVRTSPGAGRLRRGLAVCLALLVAGCSSRGTVSGTVTYRGKPVPSGNVTFVPERGPAVTAVIDGGKYTAENVPAGPAKVAVTSVSVEVSSGFAKHMQPPKDAPIPPEARQALEAGAQIKKGIDLPANYADPDKSGLSLKVTGGPQAHNIDLK
jgi:hypothetical protein